MHPAVHRYPVACTGAPCPVHRLMHRLITDGRAKISDGVMTKQQAEVRRAGGPSVSSRIDI